MYNILRLKKFLFTLIAIVGLYVLFDPIYLLATLVGYFLTSTIGFEVALHRYYTHRSFTCNRITEAFLWFCSFISHIGDPIHYTAGHRRHHKYTDGPMDHTQGIKHPFLTWWGYGITKAQYIPTPIDVSDITKNRFYVLYHQYFYLCYYAFLAVCMYIDFKLAFYALVIPAAMSLQLSSMIDVICHRSGYRNFECDDYSRNNFYVNAYALFSGMGLHNNHHARPQFYTNKVKDNEIDIASWLIKHVFATSVVDPNTN